MKKISTLFKKDPSNLGRVINEIDPENAWVYECGIPTQKFDGSSCSIIDGELYKRYDAKRGKTAPIGAIPCQEPDLISGHHPHWIKCDVNKNEDKYFFEAFNKLVFLESVIDGTYELIGKKVNGNKEGLEGHIMVLHGSKGTVDFEDLKSFSFDDIKEFVSNPDNDMEGIVFHHPTDGRMCKIRKSDFGIKR